MRLRLLEPRRLQEGPVELEPRALERVLEAEAGVSEGGHRRKMHETTTTDNRSEELLRELQEDRKEHSPLPSPATQ